MRWKTDADYGSGEEGGGDGRKKEEEEDDNRLSIQSVRTSTHVLGHGVLWRSARLVRSLTIIIAGSLPSCHLLLFGLLELAPSRRRRTV